jgi:hypothetical protein
MESACVKAPFFCGERGNIAKTIMKVRETQMEFSVQRWSLKWVDLIPLSSFLISETNYRISKKVCFWRRLGVDWKTERKVFLSGNITLFPIVLI